MTSRVIASATFIAAALTYLAAGDPASAQGRIQLPEAGFKACDGKKDGEDCTAEFQGRTITGTCAAIPADARLFCRPSEAPPPQR
jgi:hypothetical protein